jgi:hypothetical protein
LNPRRKGISFFFLFGLFYPWFLVFSAHSWPLPG